MTKSLSTDTSATEVKQIEDMNNDENDMLMSDELHTYEQILTEAILNKSTDLYPNSDENHAVVAMSVLFSNTRQTLTLLVDSFTGPVSNNIKYVQSLKRCLNRGVNVNVICLKKPNENSSGYKLLLEYHKKGFGKIAIRQATDKSIEIINSAMPEKWNLGETHNFALSDSDKYRLEFLPSKYMAVLSFNAPVFVGKCKSTFESAFQVATPILS